MRRIFLNTATRANQIFKRFNSKDSLSSNLKIIEFEKFILDFESKKHNIDTFLGLDPLLSSSFNPHLSQKNIGLFAERISKSESEYIKNKCISYKNIFNKAQFL